ncbi:MAG: DUF4198 domain-containing protein [Phycisphaerae bacterium]
MLRQYLITVLALAVAPNALAHEFWIEPSTYRPTTERVTRISLRVGEKMKGEAVPRNTRRIVRFDSILGDVKKPVPGEDGVEPAGFMRFDKPGLHTVLYVSSSLDIEIEPAKFESYLKEEGLEAISAERAKRGESDKLGREAYARSCKSLLLVGGEGRDAKDRAHGLPLELVAEQNPYAMKPGDKLTVTLLLDGKPPEGALVVGMHRDALDKQPSARTDSAGKATLQLDHAGEWLVKAVYMKRAKDGGNVEWESTWAALTFELPKSR